MNTARSAYQLPPALASSTRLPCLGLAASRYQHLQPFQNSIMKTIILTAPQGWGKTRKAQALRQELGCTSVVDDWYLGDPLKPGALHLTNAHPGCLRNNEPEPYKLVVRGWD